MDESRVELYNLDVLEFLRQLPDGCAAMVLTDPPYNIGKDKWDRIAGYVGWCSAWFREVHRILKDNGVFYFWHNDMPQIAQLMEEIRRGGCLRIILFASGTRARRTTQTATRTVSRAERRRRGPGLISASIFWSISRSRRGPGHGRGIRDWRGS